MNTRPILFQGAMVRAILDGTKTQTRRAVKLPHMNPLGEWQPTRFGGHDGGKLRDGSTIPEQGGIWHTRTGDHLGCPYGQPGDRLWVRETHAPQSDCWGSWDRWNKGAGGPAPIIHYAADRADKPFIERWRPSIHMPRWASRITLEITAVRVERLNSISPADAIAEGIGHQDVDAAVADYAALWESINGPGSWDENPWVWVVEFKQVAQTKGPGHA